MKNLSINRRQILRTIRTTCIALFFAACAQRAEAQNFNANDFSVNGTNVTDRGINDSNSAYFSGTSPYNVSIGNVTLGNTSTTVNGGDLIVTGGGSVTNAGSLSASNYTIVINGDGTVTNTNSIYATTGSAVYIAGNGTVNNSGTMNSGAANYWSVNIQGNGTSSVTNSGTMYSGFGVFVNGNGTLTNTSTGSITAFHGSGVIFDGNATVTNSGYIGGQSGPGVGIHGDGTVNNSGTIVGNTTGAGKYGGVVINGNGGASSVTNSGSITGTSSGAYAAGVNFSNPNSDFTLTNTGSISGSASYNGSVSAYGVQATSDFGNVHITNNQTITASATASGNYSAEATGISANSLDANVTVTNSQTVTGTATSVDNFAGATASAYGISAETYYGSVRVTNSGTSTGTASGYYGATASGIYAYALGGNITVSNSGQATGNATVTDFNSGTPAKGYGISASSYYGDGNITITNNGTASGSGYATATGGTASGSGYGIFARASEGNISITNYGTASGTGSGYYSASGYGILGTSTEGNITITNNGTASGGASSNVNAPSAYGINATSTDGGNVTINNGGTATASSYSGVYNDIFYSTASAYGTGIFARTSNGGSISINNSGTVSGYAGNFGSGSTYAYGLNVHTSDSGTITIQNSGTVTGTASSYAGSASGYGIWLTAGSGSVSINNTITGTISGSSHSEYGTSSPFGIYAQQGTGPMTITNRGTISANYGTGIYTLGYSGDTTVNEIGGAVISIGNPNSYSASYYAILLGSGTNTVNMVGQVNNTGIVDGGEGGNNTLTLHLAGMTPAQKVALQQAVINSQGGTYSGAVFAGGVTYAWQDFNFVSGNFVSLEQVVDPGLMDIATKLDNSTTPLPVALGPLLVDAATDPEAALNSFTGREFLNAFVIQGLSESTAISELADNRADALRLGSNGVDFSALNISSGSMIASLGNTESILDHITSTRIGGTTMSDSKEVDMTPANTSPWAAWVAGTVTIADEDNTGTNPGFTATSGSPSIGVDYRVCNDLVLGGLFNYTTAGANFSDGSRLNSDSELFGLYADWAHDHWFVNALAAGGFTSFDQNRSTLGGSQATASPDGDQVIASVTGGYDFKVAGWVLSPDVGLLYTHLTKDSYNETNAGAFDLNVGEQDVDSLRTKLGFHATRPFSWDAIKFEPEVHATWYHECLDDTNTVSDNVSAAPSIGSFLVTTNPQGRDFAAVGAGLSATPAEWHDNVTFFVNYDAQVGQEDYTAHTVDAGLRVNF